LEEKGVQMSWGYSMERGGAENVSRLKVVKILGRLENKGFRR